MARDTTLLNHNHILCRGIMWPCVTRSYMLHPHKIEMCQFSLVLLVVWRPFNCQLLFWHAFMRCVYILANSESHETGHVSLSWLAATVQCTVAPGAVDLLSYWEWGFVVLNLDYAAQLKTQYYILMLLSSRHNTDYAAQLKTQNPLCCSAQDTLPTMLLSSMLNTYYATPLQAQYWLCCSALLNTDYAALL